MISIALLTGFVLAAPIPKATEPEWMTKLRKRYELKEGEYVKRIAPPYMPERIDFMMDTFTPPKDLDKYQKRREEREKTQHWMTVFAEQDGTTLRRRSTLSSAYLEAYPQHRRGDNLLTVISAVESITGYEKPECVVDEAFEKDPLFEERNLVVSGDFVTRVNAPMDKLAAQLERILREECKVPVKLTVRSEMQDVYVVTGTYKRTPPDWRVQNPKASLQKLLDVYATDDGINRQADYFDEKTEIPSVLALQYSGNAKDFIRFVGLRIKTRMIWEGKLLDAPDNFSWQDHRLKAPSETQAKDDVDPEKVLKNIAPQTGLTFTKARRKVDVLVISPSEFK